ncbi:pyridoxal 5'-phosphate synthase glutaminase subunit PdxT [Simkania negevensis]|uniref:Pyridoxal 5'-phosphate synthase glutaminase subunit PdxT n=1 Tax=Simkania negevensis TaxID=83561 RepID=A0ABS3AUV8_9BACT|nr:pyridoxal 5'-phosphate synthase glutaminase subunit PdxT [Simkania negevensis]
MAEGRSSTCIGVLSLQGAYQKHIEMLKKLGVRAINVLYPDDLDCCDGLVIPGGETTTMTKFLKTDGNFISRIKQFAKEKPLFGTCAGLILMARRCNDPAIATLDLVDIEVQRNGYGTQANSFSTTLPCQLGEEKTTTPALFIRAPIITQCGPAVSVLAKHNGNPVLVQQGHHLAASFHPELTNNLAIYNHFLHTIVTIPV